MLLDCVCVCVCVRALQGKLQAFLAVAAQTLESFVTSLDEEEKSQTEDYNSHEHQFVLAVAGTITSESEASVRKDVSKHIFLEPP